MGLWVVLGRAIYLTAHLGLKLAAYLATSLPTASLNRRPATSLYEQVA